MASISSRDRYGLIDRLISGSGSFLLDVLLSGGRGRLAVEPTQLGSSGWSLGGRCLQLKASRLGELRLRLNKAPASRCERALTLLDLAEVAKRAGCLTRRHGVLTEGRRFGTKARGVGGGLDAELGEVEIRSSLVTHVHGLMQLALAVVAVEHHAVQGDTHELDNNLDDDADERPVLQTADKLVVNLVTVNNRAGVLNAGPSPQVLVRRAVFGVLE